MIQHRTQVKAPRVSAYLLRSFESKSSSQTHICFGADSTGDSRAVLVDPEVEAGSHTWTSFEVGRPGSLHLGGRVYLGAGVDREKHRVKEFRRNYRES